MRPCQPEEPWTVNWRAGEREGRAVKKRGLDLPPPVGMFPFHCSRIDDFPCLFVQDLGSSVLFNTWFKKWIYWTPNMVNIKELCEPLEIEHGRNIYTIDTDKHYKSGPPPHLHPNPQSSLGWFAGTHTSAHPKENLVLLGSPRVRHQPRLFSSLHLYF